MRKDQGYVQETMDREIERLGQRSSVYADNSEPFSIRGKICRVICYFYPAACGDCVLPSVPFSNEVRVLHVESASLVANGHLIIPTRKHNVLNFSNHPSPAIHHPIVVSATVRSSVRSIQTTPCRSL